MSLPPTNTALVYCDGACTGNPGPGGWGAIVLTPDLKVRELGGGDRATTNNRMELTGAIRALEFLAKDKFPVLLFTDSTYVIRGITQWVFGWQKKGWIAATGSEVANKDLWQRLVAVTASRGKEGKITWRYVRGHTGNPGNERCDEIAVAHSLGRTVELYSGSINGYDVDVIDMPSEQPLPESSKSSGPKKAAYSYLSYVNGVLTRHNSWPDCERAVKNRPGAKFKRANSAQEETAIIKSWGLDPARMKSE